MSYNGREPEEQARLRRAVKLVDEFLLIESGKMTYLDLGYEAADGKPPAWWLSNYLYVCAVVGEARVERLSEQFSGGS